MGIVIIVIIIVVVVVVSENHDFEQGFEHCNEVICFRSCSFVISSLFLPHPCNIVKFGWGGSIVGWGGIIDEVGMGELSCVSPPHPRKFR